MEKIHCKNCGKLNNSKRDYCWLCGKSLKDEEESIEEVNEKSKNELNEQEQNIDKIKRRNIIISVCIITVIILLVVITYVYASITNDEKIYGIFGFEMLGVILSIVFLFTYLYYRLLERNDKKIEKKTLYRGKYIYGELIFLSDTLCTINLLDDKIIIADEGSTYKLDYNKINNIYFVTKEQTERIYGSKGNAYGRTFVGSLLLGDIGAIAGASTSNQIISHIENTYNNYIAIVYISKSGKKSVIYLSLDDNIKKFKRRLNYVKSEYINTNEQSIIEDL